MLKTKCVSTPIDRTGDGLRVLATRFRGRGMKTTRYDVWMPNLAPDEKLLRLRQSGELTWAEFSRRYKAEIRENSLLDEGNGTIKNHGQKFTLRLLQKLAKRGNVTLMCHCSEDAETCHRYVLKELIDRA